MDEWIERVRAGGFAAIPRDLNFAHSIELAHLIDGYHVGGGVTACGHRYRGLLKRRRVLGQFRASALDLWLGLFFAHRSCRHCGTEPKGAELAMLDELAASLRPALLKLPPSQRAGILSALVDPGLTPFGPATPSLS